MHKLQVIMDNGILQVTLSKPGGIITGIQYNGIDNLLEIQNKESDRGYILLLLALVIYHICLHVLCFNFTNYFEH